MKIGKPIDNAVGGVSPRTEGASPANSSGKTSSAPGSTGESSKVTLSTAASGLMTGADGDFDVGKVSRVKHAIDDGSYKVDPEVIADKLIANAKDLLQGKQG
ncbi:MAG: flagellar biosynthesis anti-sigma factor FlgM [Aquabacterium sp.]